MRMTRLTTSARTGRRMNRSVNFTGFAVSGSPLSGIVRLRRELRVRCLGIVNAHRAAGPKPKHPRRADGVARLEARGHRDKVTLAAAEPDNLLPHDEVLVACLLVGLLVDDVDRVPERRVEDTVYVVDEKSDEKTGDKH